MDTYKKYSGQKFSFLLGLSGVILCAGLQVAEASDVSDALRSLADADVVTRKVPLTELGIDTPLALTSSFISRDIYIPVPAGVPLIKPSLSFDGRYLRGDGGTTTYVVSLDDYAVAARSPADESGVTRFNIGVDGSARDSGFVKLGIQWLPSIGKFYCDNTRPIGNQLFIEPETYLEYSYQTADMTTVAKAFSALTQDVTLLVAGDMLDQASYEAAWRLGLALERAGKNVRVKALPAPGDTVDASTIEVPDALQSIPAFAALSAGGSVTLSNAAEAGAFMLLGAPQARADVAVVGGSLSSEIDAAMKALAQQVSATEADASDAFQALLTARDTLAQPAQPGSFSVRLHGGQPVIAVEPDGARDAAGLFGALWHRTAVSGDMVVRSATAPMPEGDIVALSSLVNSDGNLDVVALGDWSTTTDLSSDVPPGKVPTALYISVSAAPGATETRPVASVFLNDILLGAKQLVANGEPEMISVDVPSYALLPRNAIVVRFQRQPASDRCRELPQAFPVSVLPGSYIQLGAAPEADDFASVAARLSGESQVVVRKSWLDNAPLTLPNAIALANSSGISPDRANFSVVDTGFVSAPIKPFLLLDVDVTGDDNRARVDRGSVTIETTQGTKLFDASGLSGVAVFETKTGGQQPGLAYLSGGPGPLIEETLRFRHGDVAVIGTEGVLAEVRTSGKPLETKEQSDRLKQEGAGFTLRTLTDRDFWFRQAPGILTTIILGGFILLMVLARSAKRRKRNDQS